MVSANLSGAAIVTSIRGSEFSFLGLILGIPNMWRLVSDMFPPDITRLTITQWRLPETFQMALAATFLGVLLILPVAVLAAKNFSPHPLIRFASKSMVSFFRTIPDPVWALIFMVEVGLGPFAGTLATIIDTIGFCGRFFADAIDDVDEGPTEALAALGSSRTDILGSAVLPAAMPSLMATSLFSLEKATRGSVVLGIVRAGGIGIELQVALELFNCAHAATIILVIFALVVVVEQISGALRARITAPS